MPELPEVETIRRDLAASITGETIRGCEVYLPRLITCPACDEYRALLKGSRIEEVGRRGKYLIFSLDKPWEWIVHLGMTGALLLDEEGSPRLNTPTSSCTSNARVSCATWTRAPSGRARWCRRATTARLRASRPWGRSRFSAPFTVKALERALATSAKVKPALLDQRRIAGIGNIYADEILFRARIDPDRPANSLSGEGVGAIAPGHQAGAAGGHRAAGLQRGRLRGRRGPAGLLPALAPGLPARRRALRRLRPAHPAARHRRPLQPLVPHVSEITGSPSHFSFTF